MFSSSIRLYSPVCPNTDCESQRQLLLSVLLTSCFSPTVLVFDIEPVDIEEGLPEGYMFIWNEDVSTDLFTKLDKDKKKQVKPSEFTDYIMRQVNESKDRLAPGFHPYRIIDNMFSNQDRNGDGKITEA